MPNVPVQILLSTWNGEHWLPELLESLRQQTFQQWQLLVRDDGSTDQTLRILLEWQAAFPDNVTGIIADGVNLGSTRSFSRLVEYSTAPFLFFCDQDDVWFPDKNGTLYNKMLEIEDDGPCVVTSRNTFVDYNLKIHHNTEFVTHAFLL